jgi:hypothetical protein
VRATDNVSHFSIPPRAWVFGIARRIYAAHCLRAEKIIAALTGRATGDYVVTGSSTRGVGGAARLAFAAVSRHHCWPLSGSV